MPKASKFSPDEGITIYDLKDNDAVHWADNTILGAKNWILNKGISQSLDGIDWTVNDDKTIKANGTKNSSNDGFVILNRNSDNYKIPTGQYIFSGYPKEGSATNNCMLKLQATRNGSFYEIASLESDVEQRVTVYDTDVLQCVCYVLPTKNVSNVIFKPMLRLASDTDNTFVPYAMTNKELTDNKFSYSDNAILGAKNLLVYPYSQTSRTVEGVEVTDNGDGTLTLNGTYTGTSYANFGLNSPISVVKNVSVKLGLIIENDDTYNIILQAWNYDGDNHQVICRPNNISDSFVITASTNNGIYLQFTAGLTGHTFNNCIVKPFILLASDTDINWRPYAMTNRELTLKEHTFDGTTDANGVVVASSIPHHPIVYCYGAPTGGGNCFVDARPGGGGIAFYCHNNGAKVASTGVKIYYYDYLD